jgi:CheY-like chemotaxis protein
MCKYEKNKSNIDRVEKNKQKKIIGGIIMRILVVDDKRKNRQSAMKTLSDHEIKIASSFDEAMEFLEQKIDKEKVQRLLAEAGFTAEPDYQDEKQWKTYREALREAELKSVIPFPFKVVLTDMMMPMSKETLHPDAYHPNEQVPYGYVIALLAALHGVKFVAMVTDIDHHQGAMSAALDYLGDCYYRKDFKPNFVINGAKVMFVHAPFIQEIIIGGCEYCKGTGVCHFCHGSGWRDDVADDCNSCRDDVGKCKLCDGTGNDTVDGGKDWGRILADLIT